MEPGMTVYDLGAESGDFTALYRSWVGPSGLVVAVEPSPPYWPSIRQTWEANDFGPPPAWFSGFVSDVTDLTPPLDEMADQRENDGTGWPQSSNGPVVPDFGFRHLCQQADSTPRSPSTTWPMGSAHPMRSSWTSKAQSSGPCPAPPRSSPTTARSCGCRSIRSRLTSGTASVRRTSMCSCGTSATSASSWVSALRNYGSTHPGEVRRRHALSGAGLGRRLPRHLPPRPAAPRRQHRPQSRHHAQPQPRRRPDARDGRRLAHHHVRRRPVRCTRRPRLHRTTRRHTLRGRSRPRRQGLAPDCLPSGGGRSSGPVGRELHPLRVRRRRLQHPHLAGLARPRRGWSTGRPHRRRHGSLAPLRRSTDGQRPPARLPENEVGPPPRPRLRRVPPPPVRQRQKPGRLLAISQRSCMGQARPAHRPGSYPMRVPVLWCSHHDDILAHGYADQGYPRSDARSLRLVPTGCDHLRPPRGPRGLPRCTRCGRGHQLPYPCPSEDVKWFTGQLDRLDWAVVLLCGDEEWVFPWQQVPETERRKVWVMQARPEHAHLSGFLPGGWYPGTPEHLRNADPATAASTGSLPARSTTLAGRPASSSSSSSTAA